MISVAIDGPSGAGKSSLAKRLAADMGFTYVDTGAMYRSIGLYAVRQGQDPHDAAAVEALLPQIHLDTKLEEGTQHFYLNGEDVSSAIRAEEIGMAASAVAAIPAVRTFLLDAQRTLAASRDVLMDGRDIGTVVLPNATVKIFLTATPEARAERRYKELLMKGEKHDYQNVLAPDLQTFCHMAKLPAAPNALSDAGYMFTLSGADLIRDIYAYCSELAERSVFGTAEVKPGYVIKLVLRLFLMDGFGAMPA